ncbi:MAG TPA: Ppx/GppA family phosphatase [Lactobacillaceae bacterium]|jgi:exopolyphosphatase/guanosine-5'-triphosphate,3'-diphosphate pyrophosphatase
MTTLAILDLGSNSVRMMVNRINTDGSYEVLDRRQEMVRMSAGMGDKKTLQPDAIDRTLDALKNFKKIYQSFGDDVVVQAVATAAIRQARNQADFLKKFRDVMGFDLRVISGEEEAEFDYIGVVNSLPINDALILDTGGASTEMILVKSGKMRQRVSLPIGAVNLTESYLEKDVVSAQSFFNALRAVQAYLSDVAWVPEARHFPIIAIGGSNRTLAKISRKRANQGDLPVHGYHMDRGQLQDLYTELLGKNKDDRIAVRGLAKERGDIIIGGLLPLMTLLEKIDSAQVIFSQSGIREGVLFSAIEAETKHHVRTPEANQLTVDSDD